MVIIYSHVDMNSKCPHSGKLLISLLISCNIVIAGGLKDLLYMKHIKVVLKFLK